MEAAEKLANVKLSDKQDREVVRVVIDCCVQEKAYNPYYAYLAENICIQNHSHKITFQVSTHAGLMTAMVTKDKLL